MSFSEQLKAARERLGMIQEQVAEQMGITKSTYCGYETGKRQPDVKKIKQLSEILKTPADCLLETGMGADDPRVDAEAFSLAERYIRLSDGSKSAVQNAVAQYLKLENAEEISGESIAQNLAQTIKKESEATSNLQHSDSVKK